MVGESSIIACTDRRPWDLSLDEKTGYLELCSIAASLSPCHVVAYQSKMGSFDIAKVENHFLVFAALFISNRQADGEGAIQPHLVLSYERLGDRKPVLRNSPRGE